MWKIFESIFPVVDNEEDNMRERVENFLAEVNVVPKIDVEKAVKVVTVMLQLLTLVLSIMTLMNLLSRDKR